MKSKLVITGILLTMAVASSAHAKTDITGDVYGEVISTMNITDVNIPSLYGVTIEDLNSGENCDNDAQICYLEGFSWADAIGWTYWDGLGLQGELGASDFPDEYIAKATYNGKLGGFIWGEKYGWVQLSACASIDVEGACDAKSYCTWTGPPDGYCEIDKVGSLPDVSAQTKDDWGVYIDFCPLKDEPACGAADALYCNWDVADNVCVFNKTANPNGQPFRGYAWSQYLGWIKFGPEAGDTGFDGAFTNWFPDLTPPVFTPSDTLPTPIKAWIPNDSALGEISWLEFVDENDSFVNLTDPNISTITVDTDHTAGVFDGCPDILTGPYTTGDLVISLGATGEANLLIPEIGIIGTPPFGFCKYDLTGVLYNASGFGYYFGSKADKFAKDDGVDISSLPLSAAPNTYDASPVILYVRAGDLVPETIPLSLNSTGNGEVADGNNTVGISFRPTDIGGNPIISVKSNLSGTIIPGNPAGWVRNVELLYDLSNSLYTYDSIDWVRDATLGNPIPIDIEASTYDHNILLQYPPPLSELDSPTPTAGYYPLDVIGYAPTTTIGNTLRLSQIDLNPNDLALPPVSPSPDQTTWPANSTPIMVPTAFSYNFEPALVVTAGELDTDFLAINQHAEATFHFINNSFDPLTEYSFDHILNFTDDGSGSELLEVEDINLTPPNLGDLVAGRTDPFPVDTRYGLLRSASFSDAQDDNQFHSSVDNYHPQYLFSNPADSDGVYQIDGEPFVSPGNPCLSLEPPACPKVSLDRSDLLSSNLPASGIGTFIFGFTPTRYLGGSSAGLITFDISQYLSYNPRKNIFPLQSVLYPATTYIQDVQVKSIGLDTSGLVSGGQIYERGGTRDLATITTTSSADLRREIRKNVAVLTRNMEACSAPQTLITPLSTTDGGCIAVDTANKTVIAYYKASANPADIISLGDATGDVTVPDSYRYTIIIEGADLNIEDNIAYPPVPPNNPNTSFGIIVMQDSDGEGGNVYLHPDPTNIVGLLYAEGSLLSSPDAGNNFYYADYAGAPSASDLTNQLFWQGSIASRNTIGGASSKVVPDGIDCENWPLPGMDLWPDVGSCAQAFDLDFIRRFTTINEAGVEFTPDDYIFSGGGSCAYVDPDPNCSSPDTLPTTVTLTGSGASTAIDVDNSKSLDTFFIERDNRPVPPGFSSKGGMTSSQEIR